MKKRVGRIIYYTILSLSLIFFAFAVVFAVRSARNEEEIYFFGFKPYIIISGSMEPTIKTYGFILVEKVDMSDIKEGDIVSFRYNKTNICHRVAEVTDKGLVTKGDNNKATDSFLTTQDNFNGKVIYYNNFIADYIKFYEKYGIFVAVILPILALVILIVAIYMIIHRRKLARRQNKKKELVTESEKTDKTDKNSKVDKE